MTTSYPGASVRFLRRCVAACCGTLVAVTLGALAVPAQAQPSITTYAFGTTTTFGPSGVSTATQGPQGPAASSTQAAQQAAPPATPPQPQTSVTTYAAGSTTTFGPAEASSPEPVTAAPSPSSMPVVPEPAPAATLVSDPPAHPAAKDGVDGRSSTTSGLEPTQLVTQPTAPSEQTVRPSITTYASGTTITFGPATGQGASTGSL